MVLAHPADQGAGFLPGRQGRVVEGNGVSCALAGAASAAKAASAKPIRVAARHENRTWERGSTTRFMADSLMVGGSQESLPLQTGNFEGLPELEPATRPLSSRC